VNKAVQASCGHKKDTPGVTDWQAKFRLTESKNMSEYREIVFSEKRGFSLFRVVLKDRGQLTIPAKLRKSLGLRAGDLLEVEVRGGYIVLKPLEVLERGADRVEESPGEGPAA